MVCVSGVEERLVNSSGAVYSEFGFPQMKKAVGVACWQ
jgi:hypothetical protein